MTHLKEIFILNGCQ